MNNKESICPICGKPITNDYVICSACGAKMHRNCIDEEILTDAAGDHLCPYDAALAALDWFDSVVTNYTHSFTEDQRRELIDRLRSYIELLERASSPP